MSVQKIDCPVCGFRFDPADSGGCGSCPLNTGCEMVCCPNCGHTTVDVNRSGLVRLASRIGALIRGGPPARVEGEPVEEFIRLANIPAVEPSDQSSVVSDHSSGSSGQSPASGPWTPVPRPPSSNHDPASPVRLSEISPGQQVQVISLGKDLTPLRCARLQAYGVVPGYRVRVIQHDPVTVIQVDHLELAMEGDVAEGIWVGME